ncbi:hypothetical protein [Thalassospira sp.]|uniref:hypothetical protein n=1 Tax=Thalassospira sp. TaxID=1912094 RepID=UPI0027364F27|nr:hypothetical protein [Thalassospira sp.]MDP2696628.1 hypothetical protein [Thalassospira sp.]
MTFTPKNILAILAVSFLAACASPAQFQNMTVDTGTNTFDTSNSPYHDAILVKNIEGGEETNPLWTSEVSSTAFKEALIASLENVGLLGNLTADAPYELQATLLRVDQPFFGLDLKVDSLVRYEIFDKKTGASVFEKEIPASHTATFGDSPFAVQRLRLANEGSMKSNITGFIEALLESDMPIENKTTAPATS